ncbi:putative arabinogalactan endo-beta-galactosidase protein [Daldinia childiae]|uniref:putative arabinogalactan endo-beta-galactosidase protein n=1 Tax=Daldinia childiae TaxID=326645 RepID=UPI0014476EC3|nr:putative arabinogalactan endo-beta-galactosidase protein [Daldinia childiae]KAF3060960.1 putative arabinogalactan endo-beta-galactosidase protein [Daldinia childiae]
MTSDTSTTETDSPSDTSDLIQITIESESDSSSRSISAGAIAGTVVGAVAFVILSVIIAALIFRRRRAKKNAANAPPVPVKSTDSSIDISPSPEKEPKQTTSAATVRPERPPTRRSFLRPLSMIQEHPLSISKPIPISASSFAPGIRRYKSAAARQSPRPNWPLSPPGNPLGSHPVDANLMKRLSDSRLGTRGLESGEISDRRQKSLPRIPVLPFPPPPPPGTRPVTPLPPLKPSRDFEGTGTTPTSATAALQSPRLSHVPVSPIMSRVFDGLNSHRAVNNPSASTTRPISAVGPEPVSPIGSDGEGEGVDDLPRLSYVSAPSAADEGGLERDELVSPIGVYEVDSDTEVPESPVTVSPLESPRGSMDS